MQGRNRDTDKETDLWTQQGGEGGVNWESSTETSPYVKWIAGGKLLSYLLCDVLEGWGWLEGGREVREGGDICFLMADSCCWTETTNTTL